jgi:hypothetical protein
MRQPQVVMGLTVVLLLIACNRKAFVAHGPVPAPPSQQVTFAGSTPAHPFHLDEGNVLSRIAFQAAGPSNSVIEVRDFMLPPHAKSHLAALPGPALLDIYSGEGALSLGLEAEKSERLVPGQMRSVPAGQGLVFDNQGEYPLTVRAFVLEVK